MKKAWISGLAACAALFLTTSVFAQDYNLGFSGNQNVGGTSGAVVSESYLATLTHAGDGPGAQGWSIGLAVEDGSLGVITSATTDGTTTADVFNGGFNKTGLALPENNGGDSGAVSAVVLCFGCPAVLPPNDTGSMVAIGVDWTVPDAAASTSLIYRDGLVGEGQPVDNVVTENGQSADFVTNALVVNLAPIVTCCADPYNLGFALGRDAAILDDTELCSGAGRAEFSPGTWVYCQAASDATDGIQGWSIGVEAIGDISITDVMVDNTSAAPEPDGKFAGGFNKTGLALPENNGGTRAGAVSAIVLCFGCGNTLEPVGTESLLQVLVDGELDASGGVLFADGLVGEGQPVDNVLTVNGASAPICNFNTAALGITLSGPQGLGPFLRGDPNDDGKVNIADPIWIINELFRSGPETACQIAADANADGGVDLADATYIISYQFLGGDAPSAPFPDCGVVAPEDAGDLTCGAAQSSCP